MKNGLSRLFAASLVLVGVAFASGCSSGGGGANDDTTGSTGEEITHGSKYCSQDSDCNHGVEGLGVICVQSGTYKGTCGDGCHIDDDCPGGGSCDKSTAHWQCDDPLPKIGTRCADDAFCSGVTTEGYDGDPDAGAGDDDFAAVDPDGTTGEDDSEHHEAVGRVCSSRSHTCIIGCHGDSDCPNGSTCDTSGTTFVCTNGVPSGIDDGSGDPNDPPDPSSSAAAPAANGCPAITYPSGVTLVTVPDSAMTAKYRALGASSCTVPTCFLDLDNLQSPDGTTYDTSVGLSAHFTLHDIVATEIGGKWSSKVLVDAKFVAKLESTRKISGRALTVSSGFRSPDHQHATCMGLCGCAQCVSNGHGGNRCGTGGGKVTCAKNSRHMWGAAADMSLSYSSAARNAGFPFVFDEYGGSGPHLHVDMKACE